MLPPRARPLYGLSPQSSDAFRTNGRQSHAGGLFEWPGREEGQCLGERSEGSSRGEAASSAVSECGEGGLCPGANDTEASAAACPNRLMDIGPAESGQFDVAWWRCPVWSNIIWWCGCAAAATGATFSVGYARPDDARRNADQAAGR